MGKAGVVVFPGSNCDRDAYAFLEALGWSVEWVWHREPALGGVDLVFLPGGFSYGDYLRSGAIASHSPVMEAVAGHAAAGKPVIGVCNGFQVLLEANLLPGAMRMNKSARFVCSWVDIRKCESVAGPWSGPETGTTLRIPIAHHEGNWYAPPDELARLEAAGQVAYRYVGNPNGSVGDVAGLVNDAGNVLGMMPHPERAGDPLLGGVDGREVFAALWERVA